MKIIALLVFLLVSIACSAQEITTKKGQKKVEISGLIVSYDGGQPLEYGTIVLQNTENPNIVTGGITDKKGRFSIKLSSGIYNLNVEYLGYKTFSLENQKILKTTNIGTIKLIMDSQQLDNIELIAEKTTVELKLDKKTYNVGNDLTLAGGNASDALSNVPSVSIDPDGSISLRGNNNVKILINGKPSTISGVSIDALKEMPATLIEKIEVITNPSSKYSSSGTAGILNIILRKNKKSGLNGSITASIRKAKSNKISANISLKRKNINIFSNINLVDTERLGTSFFENVFYDELDNVSSAENESRLMDRKTKSFSTNFGVELFIDETSSVTNAINYSKINGDNYTTLNITNYDLNQTPIINRNRNTLEDSFDEDISYSISYKKKINDKGHKLDADYQFSRGYDIEDRSIKEFLKNDLNDINSSMVITDDKQINQLLQANYMFPFGEKNNSTLEIGYRGTFDDYNIDYLEGAISNSIFYRDSKYSNNLIYNQKVNAGYLHFKRGFKNFSFSTGIRAEHTNLKVNLTNLNREDRSDYLDWFPSLFLKYDLSTKEKISINYTRRLSRPSAGSLNPFPNRVSKSNLFHGNPELTPMYTNSYEFNYINKWSKITFNSSIFYAKTTDPVYFVNIENGDLYNIDDPNSPGNTITIPVIAKVKMNLAKENRYGIDLTATYVPKKYWRFSINSYLYYQYIDSEYSYTNIFDERITKKFNIDQVRCVASFNSKIPLPYKIGFHTNFYYIGANNNSETKTKSLNRLNLSISKKFMENRASITLGVRDVFNNFQRYSQTHLSNSKSKNILKSDMRYISATINYKFNQKK